MTIDQSFGTPSRESIRMTWRTVRRIVRRNGLLILCFAFGTLLAAYGALAFVSDRFDTEAKLVVRLGRQHLEPPPTVRNASPMFANGVRREEIASEIEVLESPDLVAGAVDSIGPGAFRPTSVRPKGGLALIRYHGKQAVQRIRQVMEDVQITLGIIRRLSDREKAIAWLDSSLAVLPEKDSDVVSVTLRTGDPEFGKLILTRYIDLYLRKRLVVNRTSGVGEYLAVEQKTARERLEALEGQKLQWKQQHSLSSGTEQVNLLLRQIRDLNAEAGQTGRQIETLAREVAQSKAALESTPSTVATRRQEEQNPVLTKLRQELSRLQLERSQLLARFQDSVPQIKDADDQIQRVQQLMAEQAARETISTFETNPLLTDLQRKLQSDTIQLSGLQARQSLQKQQMVELERELQSVDAADAHLVALERDRLLAEQEYLSATRRMQDAELAADLEQRRISNVNVLSPPTSSIGPVAPQRQMILLASLVLGLLLACGIALLLNLFDERVRDAEELAESVGIPWLGSVKGAAAAGD